MPGRNCTLTEASLASVSAHDGARRGLQFRLSSAGPGKKGEGGIGAANRGTTSSARPLCGTPRRPAGL